MDKEYIEREELITLIKNERKQGFELCMPEEWKSNYTAGLYKAIQIVEKIPTTDVVEVVRCKNCKHFITDTFKRTMCNRTFTMFEMNENDFCSYGERKEGAEE